MHRADPRLKLLICLLMVVLGFAATDWRQLALVGAVGLAAAWSGAPRDGSLWRLCWMLRWLLLFTLMLHLLLSPGRTLWGTSWLSLDGLLTGAFVCVQVLVAVITSALLAMTTSADDLAGAIGWFLRPLARLGCRTGEWQELFQLSMAFLPVVREELQAVGKSGEAGQTEAAATVRPGRWRNWARQLQGLVLRLVERGDDLAHRLAARADGPPTSPAPAPLLPMARHDLLLSALVALAILGYWLAG